MGGWLSYYVLLQLGAVRFLRGSFFPSSVLRRTDGRHEHLEVSRRLAEEAVVVVLENVVQLLRWHVVPRVLGAVLLDDNHQIIRPHPLQEQV